MQVECLGYMEKCLGDASEVFRLKTGVSHLQPP